MNLDEKAIKVNIYGKDSVGWSLDADRDHLLSRIKLIGIKQAKTVFFSDIVQSLPDMLKGFFS